MFILGNGRRQVMCDEFTVKDWHVCFTYNYTTDRTLSTYQVLFPLNWVMITSRQLKSRIYKTAYSVMAF